MPQFAANLSLMYGEHEFLDRFAAAAADGFRAVECQFPYSHPAAEVVARLEAAGLRQVLINAPSGRPGERGLAALPGREDEFRRAFETQALPYAQALHCPRVHLMAGVLPHGIDAAACHATYLDNLVWATRQAGGLMLLIEPLNARDLPGYFLAQQAQAHAFVAEVGAPNLAVQMDLYHVHHTEGDAAAQLRRWLPGGKVGHLQVAAAAGRHEPGAVEIADDGLFALIDTLGWTGHVGCEYLPRAGTRAGLGWFARYRPAQQAVALPAEKRRHVRPR